MHGRNNLSKAIQLLNNENKLDFENLLTPRFHLILITCLFVDQKNY